MYRIADLTFYYTPQTDYTAALLEPYRSDGTQAQLTVQLPPTAPEKEAARLAGAPRGILELTALLRELSTRLPAFDRLVLHAASVVIDGAAYAFIAPSGTGKTSHARLWTKFLPNRAYILNGDRLFVHIQPHGATAYGCPWRGKEQLGQNASAPLKGIFVLTRSDEARCTPLSPTDALPHLVRAVTYPKAQTERLAVLSLLERLSAVVPFYHLHAPLSFAAVKAALDQTGGSL